MKYKIGVFDSGVGGMSVALAIQNKFPDCEVIYMEDSEHVPYGTKSIEQIYGFTKPILEKLVDEGCKVIVIACNTVTTNLIERLQKDLPIPLIGVEPMVDEAARATQTGVIAVCATPRTLASKRYQWLKQQYTDRIKVLEPDCSDWAKMIETDTLDREKIAKTVEEVCRAGADQIVLGCTHYHWIEDEIKHLAHGRAEVIQSEEEVAGYVRRALVRPT